MNLNNFGVSFADTSIFYSETERDSELNFLPFIQDLDFGFEDSPTERVGSIGSKKTSITSSNELPEIKFKLSTTETFSGLISDFFVNGQLSQDLNKSRNFYLLHGYHPPRRDFVHGCDAADEPVELIYSTSPSTYVSNFLGQFYDDVISYPETTYSDIDFGVIWLRDISSKRPPEVSVVGQPEYIKNPIDISYDISGVYEDFYIEYIKEEISEFSFFKDAKIYKEENSGFLSCFIDNQSPQEGYLEIISGYGDEINLDSKIYTESPSGYKGIIINVGRPEQSVEVDILNSPAGDNEEIIIKIYTELPSGYDALVISPPRPEQEVELNIINVPQSYNTPSTRNVDTWSLPQEAFTSDSSFFVNYLSQPKIKKVRDPFFLVEFVEHGAAETFVPLIKINYLYPKNFSLFEKSLIPKLGIDYLFVENNTEPIEDIFVEGFELEGQAYSSLSDNVNLLIENFESIEFIQDILQDEQIHRINYVGTHPTYIAMESTPVYDFFISHGYDPFFHFEGFDLTGRIEPSEPTYVAPIMDFNVIDFESENVIESGILSDHSLFCEHQGFENFEELILSHGPTIDIQNFEEVTQYDTFNEESIVTKSIKFIMFWKDYVQGFEEFTTEQIRSWGVRSNKKRVDYQNFEYEEFEVANAMRPYVPLTDRSLSIGPICFSDFESINHHVGILGIYDESLNGVSIVTQFVRNFPFWRDYVEDFENSNTEKINQLGAGFGLQRVDYQDFQYEEFRVANRMTQYVPLTEESLYFIPISFSDFESINHYAGVVGEYKGSESNPNIITKIPSPLIVGNFESPDVVNTIETCQSQKLNYLSCHGFEYEEEFNKPNRMREFVPLQDSNVVRSRSTESIIQNFEAVEHFYGVTGKYLDTFKSASVTGEYITQIQYQNFEDSYNEDLLKIPRNNEIEVIADVFDFEGRSNFFEYPIVNEVREMGYYNSSNNFNLMIVNFEAGEATVQEFTKINGYKEIEAKETDQLGIEDFEDINSSKWSYEGFEHKVKYIYNEEDFESEGILNIYKEPEEGYRAPPPLPRRKYLNSICFGNVYLDSIKMKQSYNGVMSSEYSYKAFNMLAQENKNIKVLGNYYSTGLSPSLDILGDQKPVGNFSIESLDSYQPEFGDVSRSIPGSRTHLIISGENSNQSFLVKPNNIQGFDLDFDLNREVIRSVNKKFPVAAVPVGPLLGKLSIENIFSDLEYGNSSNLFKSLDAGENYNVIISGKRFDDSDYQINISKARLKSKKYNGSISQYFKEKMDFTFGMSNVNLIL